MNAPNWAHILAGIGSVMGAFVAAFALRYAWQAAQAAGKQATLLEKQIRLSEPRAILVLTCGSDCMQLENVGNDLAFDVEVSPIHAHISLPGGRGPTRTLRFRKEPLVRFNDGCTKLTCEFEPKAVRRIDSVGQPLIEFHDFLSFLASMTTAKAESEGENPKQRHKMSTLTVQYRNARYETFSTDFVLTVHDENKFACTPAGSLLPPQIHQD